jgi:hypothetical protein
MHSALLFLIGLEFYVDFIIFGQIVYPCVKIYFFF